MRVILGIDPGLANTGWGLIKTDSNSLIFIASGTITTSSKDEMQKRLHKIHESICSIIEKYNPSEISIEDSFVNNNPSSSLKLGQARAAAILAGSTNDIKVYEYAPRLVKKAVVGSGRAEKNQISSMVKYLIPKAEFNNDHEADAIAMAICHVNISSTQQRINIL